MKPIAYVSKNGVLFKELPPEPIDLKPLYDHSLDLTDEEIKFEAKYFCNDWYNQNPERLFLFAKAILRKAQEN